MKKLIITLSKVGLLSFFVVITSCSTRTFSINCEPSNSLILQGTYFSKQPTDAGIIGEAPVQSKITFMGKKDMSYFTAMKRGFYPDTICVTKDSTLSLTFNLKPIVGADTITFNPENLKGAHFLMLPVVVDVYLHKGVGNLDHFELDDKKSEEVSISLDSELNKNQNSITTTYPGFNLFKESVLWNEHSLELCDYLLGLNCNLLNYYPVHPSIKDVFWPVKNQFVNFEQDSLDYIILAYCKTVKPTAGRIVGNIAVTVASAASASYNSMYGGYYGYYYDPAFFTFDNNTLVAAFVICPENGKVLYRKDLVVGYDIVGEKGQNNIAPKILEMMNEFGTN